MTYDPDWEADAALLLQAGHGAPGKELMRLLLWKIQAREQRLYALQDEREVGRVFKLIGSLQELHELWATLSAELIPLEAELDD